MPTIDTAVLRHSVRVSRRAEGAIDELGHPAISWAVVYDGLSCYFWHERGRKARLDQGQEQQGEFWFLTFGTPYLLPGDKVELGTGIVGMTVGEIAWVEPIPTFDAVGGGTHHLEVRVKGS
jgi:hypothetical protein